MRKTLDTIKSGDDISKIFSLGNRIKTPFLIFIYYPQAIDSGERSLNYKHDRQGRVAFVAGKKLGKAVFRNYLKRRMRMLCKELGGPWSGYDVVFLAKKSLGDATYSKVLSQCQKALMHSVLNIRS